jgi:7-cyano-7-deazaguanine synthase
MSGGREKAVALVSGGLDSTVSLAVAKSNNFDVHALTVQYGQRHAIELSSSKRVCESMKVSKHRIISLDLRWFGGSALTDSFEVPKRTTPGSSGIPITYVPARNTIFLSLAVGWADAIGARDIFLGVSSVDYSGYPDCRPEFIDAFEKTANLGTRAVDDEKKFKIHTPVIGLTKGETVELGLSLGVNFALTWSCYDPTEESTPCGECESCQLRARGFAAAGIEDPLLVKKVG